MVDDDPPGMSKDVLRGYLSAAVPSKNVHVVLLTTWQVHQLAAIAVPELRVIIQELREEYEVPTITRLREAKRLEGIVNELLIVTGEQDG